MWQKCLIFNDPENSYRTHFTQQSMVTGLVEYHWIPGKRKLHVKWFASSDVTHWLSCILGNVVNFKHLFFKWSIMSVCYSSAMLDQFSKTWCLYFPQCNIVTGCISGGYLSFKCGFLWSSRSIYTTFFICEGVNKLKCVNWWSCPLNVYCMVTCVVPPHH